MYLRVDDSAAQDARLVGYVTWTSGQDAGTGPFPTSAQVSGGLWLRGSSTADTTGRPWLCLVTDAGFVLHAWHSAGNAYYANSITMADGAEPKKAGDQYHTLIRGSTAQIGTYWASITSASSAFYMAGPYTGGAGSTVMTLSVPPSSSSSTKWTGAGASAYPDPISGSENIHPVYVLEAGTIRCRMPGIWGHCYTGNPDFPATVEPVTGLILRPVNAYDNNGNTKILFETSDWYS